MPVSWIEHKGKKILYADHRGLKDDDLIEQLSRVVELVLAEDEPVLLLENIGGLTISSDILSEVKRQYKRAKPNLERAAIIGVTGAKRILVLAVNKISGIDERTFSTDEKAKDYLVGV